MSDPAHHAPAAHPPAGGSDKGIGPWGIAILVIILVMSGVVSMLGQQLSIFGQALAQGIGSLFQMIKMNMTAILIIIATVWAAMALKK